MMGKHEGIHPFRRTALITLGVIAAVALVEILSSIIGSLIGVPTR